MLKARMMMTMVMEDYEDYESDDDDDDDTCVSLIHMHFGSF